MWVMCVLQHLSLCHLGHMIFSYVLLIIPRWFALIRIWSPWLAPRQGKSTFGLDKEAVMCSFLSVTGKHLVLMGISGVGDVMTLFTNDSDGNVVLRVRSLFNHTSQMD